MDVRTVTAPSGGYLREVRRVLTDGEEALVCVAFAQARGVHLVADEVRVLGARTRVVVTTTLGMSSEAGLGALHECGAVVRTLNPGGSTYHPKVFVTRRGRVLEAIVGSANLTSGLVANVEAATVMRGTVDDDALASLSTWAESIWSDARCRAWTPAIGSAPDEAIEPELLAELAAVARANPAVYTLGPSPRPNFVRDVTPSGLWVETERSRANAEGAAAAQLVPPSMLNLAWDTLRARGRLTNRELLDELRVHRSSFVCAILARLPGVKREPGREIALRYGVTLAHDQRRKRRA